MLTREGWVAPAPAPAPRLPSMRLAGLAAGAVILAVMCLHIGSGYAIYLVTLTGLNVIVVYGLNLLMGYAGQAFIAVAATFAVGAYACALGVMEAGLPFPVAWLLAGLLAGGFGLLASLPALRLGGAYLAMISIAFNVVVEQILVHGPAVMGGAEGIPAVPPAEIAGWVLDDRATAALIAVTALLAAYAVTTLRRSLWGIAVVAMRDNELAARSLGIAVVNLKAAVFLISSVIIGLSGGLYSGAMSYISPDLATIFASVTYVLMLILGGSGTILGPLIGAVLLTLLPQLLADFQQYHLIVLGLILLASVVFMPRGIVTAIVTVFSRRTADAAAAAGPAGSLGALAVPNEPAALVISGIRKSFGGIDALQGVDLVAEPGRIRGLIGPNGSGKSTLVNVVTGLYLPDGGTIHRGEVDVTGQRTALLARAGIVRTFQTPQLFAGLTVRENLQAAQFATLRPPAITALLDLPASLRASQRSVARAASLAHAAGLDSLLDRPAGELAQGDQRRLEIARALAANPAILILDEPAVGLSAPEIEALCRLLENLREVGLAMVLIEHHMDVVMRLCDRITVLNRGAVIAEGTPDEIQADADVRRAYLGVSLTERLARRTARARENQLKGETR